MKIPLLIVFKKFTPATVATTTVALLFDNSFTSRLLLELWIKSSASDLTLGKVFPLSIVISCGGPRGRGSSWMEVRDKVCVDVIAAALLMD